MFFRPHPKVIPCSALRNYSGDSWGRSYRIPEIKPSAECKAITLSIVYYCSISEYFKI